MTGSPTQRAWAIWDQASRSVLVPTVSETMRAARVNWLCCYAGVPILHDTTDETIEKAFAHMVVVFPGTQLVEIEISLPENGGWLQ